MRADGSWSGYRCARGLAIAALATLAVAAFAACSKDETGGASAGDGGTGGVDAAEPRESGGGDAADPRDAGIIDGPKKEGAECSFNRECQAALRCECSETAGCACRPGTRGTGRNGVDACDAGEACRSSVCVEGPPGSGSFCSDECKTEAECTGKLPVCADIALVGRICIRAKP